SDGTVSHGSTGLMWQQTTTLANWEDALSYCENLSLANSNDWRLPSFNELHSIADYGSYSPSIDTSYFPGTNSSFYWSSTTYPPNPTYAWTTIFNDGIVVTARKTSSNYVRCVRSGQ
ncbi:MAG: DUF1566 domain-containing protein, partial [Proteobacteria bacterium]|nr:DUF1566 domain-containing protein [Pseudomonadota bacterium]